MTRGITCPKCGRTSHNPGDVRHRFCGACHQYYDEMIGVSPTMRSPRMDKIRRQVSDLVRGAGRAAFGRLRGGKESDG